jgi:ribosomal-protein-alanine N-acetyltransferase
VTVVSRGDRVEIRPPNEVDRDQFVRAWTASRALHRPWIEPGDGRGVFDGFLERNRGSTDRSLFVARLTDGALAGVFNISQIVRGSFHSAYLGYYALRPHAGKGYMAEGLRLAVGHAFDELGLHRLQANVQPGNVRSSELLRAAGFRIEGFHPRYLHVDGAWRDHLSWVLTAEEASEGSLPPLGENGAVRLVEVSSKNWRDVVAVRARRDQSKWVADVARSMTLCRYGGVFHPLAIQVAGTIVGFVMWGRDPDDLSYRIEGLVIDRLHQRKGYGGAGVRVTIAFLKRQPGCREIALTYHPGNEVAHRLFSNAGFEETGEVDGDKVVARLPIDAAVRDRRPRS